jgi:hypothetical protein
MRQPHVWGGEPELLMASHVLGYVNASITKMKKNAIFSVCKSERLSRDILLASRV